ncbi:hypothetical protein NicSoilB8_25650 [Arthrobacter sp. NicSoilB8]|nr:hypothetical protein NicSoilB8_25650 [Arthrobacter sp. NicSoilB8]
MPLSSFTDVSAWSGQMATPAKLRLALASMRKHGTKVSELCTELGVTRQTLYRHVSPTEERPDGEKLMFRLG